MNLGLIHYFRYLCDWFCAAAPILKTSKLALAGGRRAFDRCSAEGSMKESLNTEIPRSPSSGYTPQAHSTIRHPVSSGLTKSD